MKKDYYLGLDLGTNSIGWAVTDSNYNLLRVKGKDLWGIREFDEADTAAERRTHRVSRRRRQRQVVRMGHIKSLFDEEIRKTDPYFFERLENSKYHLEDKDENVRYKYGVFNDCDFGDKEYYEKYPTIFHLRKELIDSKEPHDIRLVYLAVANMFKRRGHFLNAGLDGSSTRKMSEVYAEFAEKIQEYAELAPEANGLEFPHNIDTEKLCEILASKEISRSAKAEQVQVLICCDRKNKIQMAYIKTICGLKTDAAVMFPDVEFEDKTNICFSDYDYEEKKLELQEKIGEGNFFIVDLMKEMYDIGILAGIRKGYNYLCEARVASYEKHKKDLEILKKVIKENCSEEDYNFMFRSDENGSYSAYVNSTQTKGKTIRRNMKGRTADDLYKTIKKMLKDNSVESEDAEYILREMETESFLPKQLTAANGVIPNQLHKIELEKILDNASSYLEFLNETDETGLTVKDKINRLYAFQIPYYVGPVSVQSERSWVVRKAEGPVLPWNIEEKIDLRETSSEFIKKLIRDCTYISGEKVLPKDSLLYEKFCVLNELNNLRVNGEKISVCLKQELYENLFMRGKKVSRKQIFNYLHAKGLVQEDEEITGIDKNINNSLSSHGKFQAIFGEKIREDEYRNMAEDIVFWCTVYGDAKKFLKQNLEEKYGTELSETDIRRICGFKFHDWGRMSREFLTLQGVNKVTGEFVSIIQAMWNDESNPNLMELLHSDCYTFAEELEKKQNRTLKTLAEVTFEDLEDTYFSAPVKRMVWQTIKIMKELERVLGAPPSRVFVEMARSDDEKGDKGRKDSRKDQLQKLYKTISGESPAWKKEMGAQIERADESGRLRSKKMYLYFTQMGRCMYTGEPIDLDDLFNNNLYDIDHIYPRHYVKDDNINNNLVLVKKETNAFKSDSYPIEDGVRNNQTVRSLWRKLKDNKLITDEKYRRLTGANPFTDEQMAGFIARQLVETSQGTKGVAEILRQLLPENSEIVYAKARNVSEFRKENKLLKSRSVNDFHHAHDAYLNIVIGNAYYVKFTKNPLNFISKEFNRDRRKYNYNLNAMFRYDIARGDDVAWVASGTGKQGTIETVKKTMARNTPLLTRMNYEVHGGIANETIYGKETAKPDVYIPLKSSDNKMQDVTKYGGFTSATTAYFFLVEHDEKGKKVRTIETAPVYLKEKIEEDENGLEIYCRNNLKLVNPSIRLRKIKTQSLIKKDGYYMHISGKTGERLSVRNAVEMCLKQKWINYIHDIEKYAEKGIMNEGITTEQNIELYDVICEKHIKSIYAKKPNSQGKLLEEGRNRFIDLSIDDQLYTLSQLLKLTLIGVTSADLTNIGGKSKSGVSLISKKISNCTEFKLINQSVTGIYEQEIDLLTV